MATKVKQLNNATLEQDINSIIERQLQAYNIDVNNLQDIKQLRHNDLLYIFRCVYNELFKPNITTWCNKHSIIDYENIEQLTIIASCYIEWCTRLNKSIGLQGFSYFTGIAYSTLYCWLADEANPKRSYILKSIQENHKLVHIGLLNETPVGALAVANNDVETGLQWQQQATATVTKNNVYFIPSERVDKLRLELQETPTE